MLILFCIKAVFQRKLIFSQPSGEILFGRFSFNWSGGSIHRKIVGWANDKATYVVRLKTSCQAILPPAGLIHHSDRGSQYASHDYQQALKDNEMVASMSRKGNCYDNACMESFFGTLKRELIYGNRFTTRAQVRQAIFEYIEVF